MSTLTFIHMTDIHIQPEDSELFMGIDTAQKFTATVDYIKGMGVKPAFFAISGDLVQDAEDDGYERLKGLLSQLDSFGVPVLLGLGNHDNRVSFQRVMLGETETDESRRYYHSHTFDGYKVIMLDSRETGKVHGTFDDAQMAWLKGELADGMPTVLIFHHPPVTTPYALLDSHMLVQESIDKFAAAIDGQNVIGILNGHIHFNNVSAFKGIATIAGGHVAFMLDPYETEGMKFINGSGFNVVTLKNGLFTLNPTLIPGEYNVIYHLSNAQLASLAAEHGG